MSAYTNTFISTASSLLCPRLACTCTTVPQREKTSGDHYRRLPLVGPIPNHSTEVQAHVGVHLLGEPPRRGLRFPPMNNQRTLNRRDTCFPADADCQIDRQSVPNRHQHSQISTPKTALYRLR